MYVHVCLTTYCEIYNHKYYIRIHIYIEKNIYRVEDDSFSKNDNKYIFILSIK